MGYYRDIEIEKEINDIKEEIKRSKINECFIRKYVGKQKGELSIDSKYYKGNISEGNWSLIENDLDIKKLDEVKERVVDATDVILGLDSYPTEEEKKLEKELYTRKNDAEYEYVFTPSYYLVKMLIWYYINDMEKANNIYNLKNAVVRHVGRKYTGGLPFVLKYIDWILKKRDKFIEKGKEKEFEESGYYEIFKDFNDFICEIVELIDGWTANGIYDEFLSDVCNCIMDSRARKIKYEIRIEEIEKDKTMLIEYNTINGYDILMHPKIEKIDYKHLQKYEIKLIEEHIDKTPYHPFNNTPKDSRRMEGKLKDWYEQKVASKKEKMVYRKDDGNKKVYIATVSDHYKYAEGRTRSLEAYK